MSSNNTMQEKAIIIDIENQDLKKSLREAFEQADILPLIKTSREIYVHIPLGATLFRDGNPLGGTYLDVELAEAIVEVCCGKPITFYEAPATAHKNVKPLFEKLNYTQLAEKYSQVRLLDLNDEAIVNIGSLSLKYQFDYPPIELPKFLFDKENLIISFSNPKAPFSESAAGFRGLPFSLSGKSLIMGSTLFYKKNLLHLAFSDLGLGLKDYVIDGLDKINKMGVNCIGINGGRLAGAMIKQVKIHPVDWNLLVISKNIGIADAVTATLMGFQPQNIGYFAEMAQRNLIPSDLSTISVIEIGNGRKRLEDQLKKNNPFLPQESTINTRQWIVGLMKQVPFKTRLRMAGRILPSVIKYKLTKKRKQT